MINRKKWEVATRLFTTSNICLKMLGRGEVGGGKKYENQRIHQDSESEEYRTN